MLSLTEIPLEQAIHIVELNGFKIVREKSLVKHKMSKTECCKYFNVCEKTFRTMLKDKDCLIIELEKGGRGRGNKTYYLGRSVEQEFKRKYL